MNLMAYLFNVLCIVICLTLPVFSSAQLKGSPNQLGWIETWLDNEDEISIYLFLNHHHPEYGSDHMVNPWIYIDKVYMKELLLQMANDGMGTDADTVRDFHIVAPWPSYITGEDFLVGLEIPILFFLEKEGESHGSNQCLLTIPDITGSHWQSPFTLSNCYRNGEGLDFCREVEMLCLDNDIPGDTKERNIRCRNDRESAIITVNIFPVFD